MNRIITIVLFATFALAVFGCGQDVQSTRQPMPASTLPVLEHINECDFWYWHSYEEYENDYETCREDPPISIQQCNDDYEEGGIRARSFWELCLQQLPMVDYSCVEQLQPFSREQDTDGDGVADYWEYQMGLNPCEPCSYGGTPGVDCDGDLNYDRDARNNAEDSEPMCGQMYDGEWHADPEGINGSHCV